MQLRFMPWKIRLWSTLRIALSTCLLSWNNLRFLWCRNITDLLYLYICALSHVWLWDPMDSSPSGSSVHGSFQARLLDWVAIYELLKLTQVYLLLNKLYFFSSFQKLLMHQLMLQFSGWNSAQDERQMSIAWTVLPEIALLLM